jgi:phosphate starvation-inducible PhoH-like protein
MKKPKKQKPQRTSTNPVKKINTIPQKDNSPYVFQRDKIAFDLQLRELPWTQKQKDIIELMTHKDTKVLFLSGPAGTSKSIVSTYCALKLLNEKRVSEVIYIRSVIESASKSLGYLPGTQEEKMSPFLSPLVDKMEELLPQCDVNKLVNEGRVKGIPINFLRGASFNVNFIIADEMQNAEFSEIQTIITRIGNFSKFIFCGDPMQTDIHDKSKSGFKPIFDIFNNQESRDRGIFCVELGKEDILRSEILKFIVEKLEIYKK